jgi:hypothetical protein
MAIITKTLVAGVITAASISLAFAQMGPAGGAKGNANLPAAGVNNNMAPNGSAAPAAAPSGPAASGNTQGAAQGDPSPK